MNIYLKIIILYIFTVFSSSTFSQSPNIKFKHLSIENGLSQSTIYAILQDSQGFLWIGTQDGLNKYDGYQFTIYRHKPQNIHSLSHNQIFALYEDSKGHLWIGTGRGLNRYDRQQDRFIRYFHEPKNANSLSHNTIWSISEDQKRGLLWIGTNGGGLNQFDLEKNKFVHYKHNPQNPQSLSYDAVWPLYQDKAGILWIGTDGGGLNKLDLKQRKSAKIMSPKISPNPPLAKGETSGFDSQKKRFTHYLPNPQNPKDLSNFITSIYEDSTKALWIGTLKGLHQFDRQQENFVHYFHDPKNPQSLSHRAVWAITEDNTGTLWVGTDGGGLNRFDRQTNTFIHYQHDPQKFSGLNDDQILSLYKDKAGTVWIGTSGGGINQFNPTQAKFAHYRHEPKNMNSLSDNDIFAIHQDKDGFLWVGTEAGGLNRFDPQRKTVTHYRHDPKNPNSLSHDGIQSLYEDSTGVLWIGTYGEGLNRFVPQQNQFEIYRHDPNNLNSLSNNYVMTIYEDKTGTLWIGTRNGLNQFDRQRKQFVSYYHNPNNLNSLSHQDISTIYEDSQGILWIGTQAGGLNQFDRQHNQFVHYQFDPQNPTSLNHNEILSIYEDKTGRLWIGTYGGGLNQFDRISKTFFHYTEEQGLVNDVVYGILEDEQGYLWLSTNRGLSKFDPNRKTFRNYDVLDGLQSKEFNAGAYHKSLTGELFFGGINGLNAFYPEQVKDNPYIPPIVITDFKIFNQTVKIGKDLPLQQHISITSEITLSYRQSFFTFEFAALNFLQPQKNQYAYQLEGFDKQWNQINNQRRANYTNVLPGTYWFRVKGSNNDQVWNEQGTAIKITILPPFWKTWWAYTLYTLTLLTIILGYIRHQQLKLRTKQQELEREQEIALQLREADKLKDQFLANTSHELRTPLNGIIGIAESLIDGAAGPINQRLQNNLTMIVNSGRRLFSLVNDILDFSKLKQNKIDLQIKAIDIHTLTEVVLTLTKQLIGSKKLQLINAIPPDLPPINADENRVQQILYNLVGNAIKFTDSGTIEIFAKIIKTNGVNQNSQTLEKQSLISNEHRKFRDSVTQFSEPNSQLAITVSDTGIGIQPEKLDKIFEAFEQADGSTARIYGGTGLGLAVTQQLVHLHNGKMSVQSQEGTGSHFTFTLPLSSQFSMSSSQLSVTPFKEKQITEQLAKIENQLTRKQIFQNERDKTILKDESLNKNKFLINEKMDNSSQIMDDCSELTESRLLITERRFTILVVDDDFINRQVIVNHLSLHNYTIHQADSGNETIIYLKQHGKPDLILLDVMMPQMSGYEVTRQIRQTWPADELPIILLTAKNQVTDLVVGLDSGANDYLTKPVSKNELIARLKAHLHILHLKAEALHTAIENKNKLKQLLEALPLGVAVLNTNGNPSYINQRAKQLLGRGLMPNVNLEKISEVYQLYRAGTNELYPPEQLSIVRALRGEHLNLDDLEIHQADKIIPVETWGTPIFNQEGHITCAMSVFQDITERKQAERFQQEYNNQLENEVAQRTQALRDSETQLRQAKEIAEAANHAKSQFLASMSHELRTPLNSILGYAQILQRDSSLGSQQLKQIGTIKQSGEHLLQLINDILDLAKIEAGKIKLDNDELELKSFLNHIKEMIDIRAIQKELSFTYQPYDFINQIPQNTLPVAVYGDEKRLRQILVNLLGNAIKFTETGGITFKVGLVPSEEKQNSENRKEFILNERDNNLVSQVSKPKIRFQIEDTGIGIAPAQLETIFERFQQVGNQQYQNQGTGLGLSISRHLVQLMGAQLQVTSQLGKGSIFWFDLELPEIAGFSKHTTIDIPKIIGVKSETPITLLIVDDKPNNRLLLVDLLTPLGFNVIQADNGQTGLAKAKESQPQVIIVDLFMPEFNGFELIRQLRQLPQFQKTVIITASATVSEADYQQSFLVGSDDFLPKPINATTLFEQLQGLLGIDWIYADSQTNQETVMPFIFPSPEILKTLYQFAIEGDVRALETQARQLVQLDAQFTPFVDKIMKFMDKFQMDLICNWLESYLESEEK